MNISLIFRAQIKKYLCIIFIYYYRTIGIYIYINVIWLVDITDEEEFIHDINCMGWQKFQL